MPFFGSGFGVLGTHEVDRVYRFNLPDQPEQASMMSLDYIHALAREGREDPVVRHAALQIVRGAGVREKDFPGMIVAVHRWIQQHLYYVHDPAGVEMLTQARVLLAQIEQGNAAEDCDSFVLLEHALLNSLGIVTQSVIWKADRRDPTQWSHITLEAFDGRGWVPLDPIMKDKPVGWSPPKFFARRVVPIRDGPPFPLPGGGRVAGATVEYLPRNQARQSMAGWFAGASNMVGWRGYAGYGADAAVVAGGPTPAMVERARHVVATFQAEIRELRDMQAEAMSTTEPLMRSVEPLVATAEAAGHRIEGRVEMLGKINKIVKYAGYVLTALSSLTAGITELIGVALAVANAAYQIRQAAALMTGSAAKTLNEVSSALTGIEQGLTAAADVASATQGLIAQRERVLEAIYAYYPGLAPEPSAQVLAVQAQAVGGGAPVMMLAAAAAGLAALAWVL